MFCFPWRVAKPLVVNNIRHFRRRKLNYLNTNWINIPVVLHNEKTKNKRDQSTNANKFNCGSIKRSLPFIRSTNPIQLIQSISNDCANRKLAGFRWIVNVEIKLAFDYYFESQLHSTEIMSQPAVHSIYTWAVFWQNKGACDLGQKLFVVWSPNLSQNNSTDPPDHRHKNI